MSAPRTIKRLLLLLLPAWRGLGLATLLTTLALASGIGLMATAAYAISRASQVTDFVAIQVVLVYVRFFAISRGATRYLERYISHDVTFRVLARLRVWLYAAIEPLAPAALWRRSGGDLLARIVDDIETLERFPIRVLLPACAALLITVAAASVLAVFDWRLGVTLVAAMVVLGAVLPLLARRADRRAAMAEGEARGELSSGAVDGVQGIADLLAAGAGPSWRERMEECSRQLERAQLRLALTRGVAAALGALVTGALIVAILALAVPLIREGRIQPVYLATLPLTALAALEAVLPMGQAIGDLERSVAAAARLFDLVDTPPAVRDPVPAANPPRDGRLEVSGLAFQYPGGEDQVLADVSFSLPEGGRLAITGPSGAGKSTLLNLLLRFWEADAGSIRIGGRDVRTCRADDVRALIGVVSQETHLFAGTIRTNLLLARPEATTADLDRAVAAAQLEEVIARLPEGYDTWVGENGLQLSGGERQRLAIARALLKDAPILLLDEATAHLDLENEALVLGALDVLCQGRTVLVAGHRAAAVAAGGDTLRLGVPPTARETCAPPSGVGDTAGSPAAS